MKHIVYNYDNLKEEEINNESRRAKAIIKNSKNEILLACVNENYHLPGGHLEENETNEECLVREIMEEVGVEIPLKERKPILKITYYNRDYPETGLNTKSEAIYYEVNEEIIPNMDNISLTADEKNGQFRLEYIKMDNIIKHLEDSIEKSTRVGVIKDTIEAIKEYLNPERQ